MSKADEMWRNYGAEQWDILYLSKDEFLAALKEYGELVRAEDVNIPKNLQRCTCDGYRDQESCPHNAWCPWAIAAAIKSKPLP